MKESTPNAKVSDAEMETATIANPADGAFVRLPRDVTGR